MFITAELLRKYKACEDGIRYIEHFYPDGAEVIDIIKDSDTPKEMLHWGRKNLTHSNEELNAYCERCEISNSEGFWYSENVSNSKYVVESKNVNNSKSIFKSKDITDCQDIVNTEEAEGSAAIFDSFMIEKCAKVVNSKNVVIGTNICNSTMVARSINVIDSFQVFDSSEIVKSTNVSNSHFCQDCKNIKFCMFCEGLEDAEYCIFNKPVDKNLYELFEKQYKKYMTVQLTFIAEWPVDLVASTYVAPTRKFDEWYKPISEKFWRWLRTLPGFDSMLMYQITMLPELLIDN